MSSPYDASTYSRSWVAFGKDFVPLQVTHGDGWRTFGVDGRDFLDMIMGIGSVILGHRNPEVDEAVRRQLANGTAMSLAHPLEEEAAERLLAHFPPDHMVQWGTNGSDATTGAIRLARAETGRDCIYLSASGYHGFHDWALADTQRGYGIPYYEHSIRINSLSFLEKYPSDVAAVIIEPDLHPDWLKPIREWCTEHDALMIADEVMTWQRYPEWTASAHYGVQPDLWCLGKSLANGLPVSAIVGPSAVMKRFAPGPEPNAFFSSTWAGHPLSMAAVVATLDVMEREDGPRKIWEMKVPKYKAPVGDPPFRRIKFPSQSYAKRWRSLMARHGVLIYGSFNWSLAHDTNAMTRLANAWDVTAKEMADFEDAEPELETSGIMRR